MRLANTVLRMDVARGATKRHNRPEKWVGQEKLQVSLGDVAGALAPVPAERKLEVTYRTPIENHNPIEPYCTMAEWLARGPARHS